MASREILCRTRLLPILTTVTHLWVTPCYMHSLGFGFLEISKHWGGIGFDGGSRELPVLPLDGWSPQYIPRC